AQVLRRGRAGRAGQLRRHRAGRAHRRDRGGVRDSGPAVLPDRRGRLRDARPGAGAPAGWAVRASGPGMTVRAPQLVSLRAAVEFGVVVAILAAMPLTVGWSAYTHNLVTLAFLMVTGALAWNWMGGFVGQVSFGHAAMFGVGGFVSARLILSTGLPAP